MVAKRIGLNGEIDHKDRNPRNCKRNNLRLCTRSQNAANQGLSKVNTSGFKGVTFEIASNKWKAQIKFNYQNKHLGLFLTPEEAAKAHDKAAKKKYLGEFAFCNFPQN